MARIERATSPLPRECSTTEPHGHRYGFDDAAASGLGKPVSTDQTLALERETGIEPASLAWKARVLPLNYSRPGAAARPLPQQLLHQHGYRLPPANSSGLTGGGGWIRTNVGVSQQIYSLPPLATRAPLREEPQTIPRRGHSTWRDAQGSVQSKGSAECARTKSLTCEK